MLILLLFLFKKILSFSLNHNTLLCYKVGNSIDIIIDLEELRSEVIIMRSMLKSSSIIVLTILIFVLLKRRKTWRVIHPLRRWQGANHPPRFSTSGIKNHVFLGTSSILNYTNMFWYVWEIMSLVTWEIKYSLFLRCTLTGKEHKRQIKCSDR